jgi:hypothetical protein
MDLHDPYLAARLITGVFLHDACAQEAETRALKTMLV